MATVSGAATAENLPDSAVRARGKFYIGMAGVLLLIVLVGFSPTLYLRAYFDVPALPTSLIVHGIICTAWFTWLFVQTTFVIVHRTDLHRRMGVLGVGLGGLVLATGLIVALSFISRMREQGIEIEANAAPLIIIWQNFALLTSFAVLLVLAVVFRRRPEIHKRLMLLASISLISPAVARIARWTVLGGQGVAIPVPSSPLIPVTVLGLLLALVVHDIFSRRRVHPATLAGALFFMFSLIAAVMIANTEFGYSFIRSLLS